MIPLQFALRRRMMGKATKRIYTVRITGTPYFNSQSSFSKGTYILIDEQYYQSSKSLQVIEGTIITCCARSYGASNVGRVYLNNVKVAEVENGNAIFPFALTGNCNIRFQAMRSQDRIDITMPV